MGSVVTKAMSSVETLVGNALLAPFKTIFGASCEGICSGIWDLTCFIEHLCISSLVRLFMVLGLTYIILLFIYLLFQVRIIQCVGRNLCKMVWAACELYWTALRELSCFCCYKMRKTKRANRRSRQLEDMEQGYLSSDHYDSYSEKDSLDVSVTRRHKLAKDRRKEPVRKSLYLIRQDSKRGRRIRRRRTRQRHGSKQHVRLDTDKLRSTGHGHGHGHGRRKSYLEERIY